MQLSGGEQQRLAIARSLVNEPMLVMADAPTGNLDSGHAIEVLSLLRRFNRERGQTVILVTHDAQVGATCDRILRMRDGLIIGDEPVSGKAAAWTSMLGVRSGGGAFEHRRALHRLNTTAPQRTIVRRNALLPGRAPPHWPPWCACPPSGGSIGAQDTAEDSPFMSHNAALRAPLPRLFAIGVSALMLALSLSVSYGAGSADAKKPQDEAVTIQFLNVSDWHGQLDPLSVFGVGNIGGASVISTYWQADRAANPNTLSLTAGDDFGAAPPLSNFFNDEPAVLAQRMMGIQVGTFGNHNFDKGIDYLQHLIDLAGSSTAPGDPYQYVSANLQNRDDNLSGVKDFAIFDVGGLSVGVVGITNPEAPELVFPGSFGTIIPTDSVAAANDARKAAKKAGADIVVAIIHAGVRGFDPNTNAPFGELVDFANGVKGFDVIFGDHTDVQYTGVINGQLVLENRSKGRTYARTELTVDPRSGRVLDQSVEFIEPICLALGDDGACIATPLGPPDAAIEAVLQPFRDELGPILREEVGSSTVEIPHADVCGSDEGRECESLVGDTVADALRQTYGTDFAITNSGGLRDQLTCPETGSAVCPAYTAPPYLITRGQVLTVLPFGNQSATFELTGADLNAMLENGVSRTGAQGRFPQVSGFCFEYDLTLPAGERVTSAVRQAEDGSCTGDAVDLTSASTYSITTNDFVASGGDGYPVFSDRMVTRGVMAADVAAWLTGVSPISPEYQGRITCTAGACPVVLAP
jgi:2',3'-cyclic-nucleotide 2'-phosphodiesterase (5'-nucleotidase family)